MLHPVIKDSLDKSMSYQEYSDLVNRLVETEGSTGTEQTDAMVDYTKLNQRRMKRWDKTIKVSEEFKTVFRGFNNKMTWLVITESWCGDAAHVVPVINKLVELNDKISLKIVLRDENLDLMDMFLTNGGRAIPKLLMIDDASGEVVNTFGPRPSEATTLVNKYKEEHGAVTPELKEALQFWYNKNKGQNIIEDITQELCKFEPAICM